jgi:hypothetical protein
MVQRQHQKRSPNFKYQSTGTRIPPYLLIPTAGLAGSLVFGYYYFLEEAPFTKRKRLLATVRNDLIKRNE